MSTVKGAYNKEERRMRAALKRLEQTEYLVLTADNEYVLQLPALHEGETPEEAFSRILGEEVAVEPLDND